MKKLRRKSRRNDMSRGGQKAKERHKQLAEMVEAARKVDTTYIPASANYIQRYRHTSHSLRSQTGIKTDGYIRRRNYVYIDIHVHDGLLPHTRRILQDECTTYADVRRRSIIHRNTLKDSHRGELHPFHLFFYESFAHDRKSPRQAVKKRVKNTPLLLCMHAN